MNEPLTIYPNTFIIFVRLHESCRLALKDELQIKPTEKDWDKRSSYSVAAFDSTSDRVARCRHRRGGAPPPP